jgi:ferredoxin
VQTGVIVLASSVSEEVDRLTASLLAKEIPVLQCIHGDLNVAQKITNFVANNRLETVVISNVTEETAPDSIRHTIENAGLGNHAVSWVDLAPLLGQQSLESRTNTAYSIVLVNVARLQRAEHINHIVLKTMARSSRISRRDLFRAIPKVLRVESDVPIVFADLCRDRSRSCSYCAKACPVNAVSAAEGTVTIDDRRCIECGACARDCPTGAIQSPSISDAQMIAVLNALTSERDKSKRRGVVLTCPMGLQRLLDEGRRGKHLDADHIPIQIPCVSSVGAFHYFSAASLGIMLATVCPDISCKRAVGMFPLYQHVTSCKHVLSVLRKDCTNSVQHLGLHANDSIVDLVSQATTPVSVAGVSTIMSGTYRREIMVDAIRALRPASGRGIELREESMLPLFDVKVDDSKCTFCEVCQKDCPDHAIEFRKIAEGLALTFDPALCSGCGICKKDCPEKAIMVSGLTNFSLILEGSKATKALDENAKCKSCGATLGSKRSIADLRKTLSDKGVTEATLAALNLCTRCKQNALIQPVGHMHT